MPKAKILVVEDDPEIRRLYAIGLNQRGFEVKLAANGAEAIERIRCERPDVVLLDWMMPLMSGGEVLEHVDSSTPVHVIVISGQTRPEDEVLDDRIKVWLTKPVSLDEVVHQIEHPGLAGLG